jgi:uncharacterized membrane protein YeaQ/YmgE (transglycosylase-associated protein family)
MQFSCIVAAAVAIFITVESFKLDYPIMPLMALTAALLGWMIGILASPTTKEEKDQFGELAKVVAGFVSGYLLSKIDPLVAMFLNPEHGQILDPLVAMRLLVTLSSFFVTLVTVFAVRLFWKWGADEEPADA